MKYKLMIIISILLICSGCTKEDKREDVIKFASVEGTLVICNNGNCGEILSDQTQVSIAYVKRSIGFPSIYKYLYEYKPQDSIKDYIEHYLEAKGDSIINNGIVPFQVAGSFNGIKLDTSKLCNDCDKLYKKYNLEVNTQREIVNIRKAGFASKESIKNSIAMNFGFRSFKDCQNSNSDHAKSSESACRRGYFSIANEGLDYTNALVEAESSYSQRMRSIMVSRETSDEEFEQLMNSVIQNREGNSKSGIKTIDPDDMTDEEWYDYIESLSDDPAWKETVRDQKKAKGL